MSSASPEFSPFIPKNGDASVAPIACCNHDVERSTSSSQDNVGNNISPNDAQSSGTNGWTKNKYFGLFMAICSSLVFVLTALVVKQLKNFDPINISLYRCLGCALPAIPLFIWKLCVKKGRPENSLLRHIWPLDNTQNRKTFGFLFLRSFLACNALLLHFWSLKYLSLGDALTILSISPIFVAILARIFLGEKCGYSSILAAICALLGVTAIMKPPIIFGSRHNYTETLIGSCLAFGCTLIASVSFVTLRHLKNVHYSVTALMYGAWGVVEMTGILLIIPGFSIKFPTAHLTDWLLISALAALTLLGQIFVILAFKYEQAGPVTLVKMLDTFFGFLLDIAVLGKMPDIWSMIGATVIVLSVSVVAVQKWLKTLPQDNSSCTTPHVFTALYKNIKM